MSGEKPCYLKLVDHYEDCFIEHGATPKGVDWPNDEDLKKRFKIMLNGIPLQIMKNTKIKLLDVGCGYGALLDHVQQNSEIVLDYHGIDLSHKMINYAQTKHPKALFEVRNLLENPLEANRFDFAILNGVFTEKRSLQQQEMEDFFISLVKNVYHNCRYGIAFNVMNHHVDWYRDDLFYLSFDRMAILLKEHCSRHFRFIADYGLYEYTVYLYKQAYQYD